MWLPKARGRMRCGALRPTQHHFCVEQKILAQSLFAALVCLAGHLCAFASAPLQSVPCPSAHALVTRLVLEPLLQCTLGPSHP